MSCFCTEKSYPWSLTSALWCQKQHAFLAGIKYGSVSSVLLLCFGFPSQNGGHEQPVDPLPTSLFFTFLREWFSVDAVRWFGEGLLKWHYVERDGFCKCGKKCQDWWKAEVGMRRVITERWKMSKRILQSQELILRPAVDSFWYYVKNSCWLHKSMWIWVRPVDISTQRSGSGMPPALLPDGTAHLLSHHAVSWMSGKGVALSTFPVTADEIVLMAFTFPHEEAPGGWMTWGIENISSMLGQGACVFWASAWTGSSFSYIQSECYKLMETTALVRMILL